MAIVTETAEVVAVEGDHIWVETERKAVCDACAVQKGCGSGIISRMFRKRARLRIDNTIGARAGDRIILGLDDRALVRASLAVYLMPLVWLLLGALGGQMLATAMSWEAVDGAAALGGVTGLLAGFLWLRGYARRSADRHAHQPVLLRHAGVVEDGGVSVMNYQPRPQADGAGRKDARNAGPRTDKEPI